YWLLDEPTASLDIAHEVSTLRLLRTAASRNIGVAVVLHDLEKAAQFCDSVVLIHAGQVAITGRPREVLSAELLTDVYGTPIATEWHAGLERLLVHA
ncbi:MAG: Fe3+-hydroxamate ABC transporter ATP-binding protein FhuC, partial [Pseudomonadota bacterium]